MQTDLAWGKEALEQAEATFMRIDKARYAL